MTFVLPAMLFAAAGWGGARAAEPLYKRYAPHADGPAPIAFVRWPFAVAGACIGIALSLHGVAPAHLAVLLLVTVALAGCTAADLACGMLPDLFTIGPLAVVTVLGLIAGDWTPLLGATFVFIPFAIAVVATCGRGMGWGDAKLAALGGALLGAGGATLAFMLAALAAYVIARRSGATRRPIAFGPYLATSIAATLSLVRTT